MIKYVFWFFLQLLSGTFLILRRIQRAMIKNVYFIHVKYPLFSSDFNETWNFLTDFFKNTLISYFMKNPSSGSRVVPYGQTDRQRGMAKLIVTAHNFANMPINRTDENWTSTKTIAHNYNNGILIKYGVMIWASKGCFPVLHISSHHHHHHVPEGLGMLSCSLILKMKLVPPSLPQSSYVSSSFWFIL